jgi:hypothetical protein
MPLKHTETTDPSHPVDCLVKHVIRVHAAQAHVPTVAIPYRVGSTQQQLVIRRRVRDQKASSLKNQDTILNVFVKERVLLQV